MDQSEQAGCYNITVTLGLLCNKPDTIETFSVLMHLICSFKQFSFVHRYLFWAVCGAWVCVRAVCVRAVCEAACVCRCYKPGDRMSWVGDQGQIRGVSYLWPSLSLLASWSLLSAGNMLPSLSLSLSPSLTFRLRPPLKHMKEFCFYLCCVFVRAAWLWLLQVVNTDFSQ